jgi:hypothetical protein
MFKLRSGKLYGHIQCGKCNVVSITLPMESRIRMIYQAYQWQWGKSSDFGFVCPDCVYDVVDNEICHVWVMDSNNRVGTAKIA